MSEFSITITFDADSVKMAERIAARTKTVAGTYGGRTSLWCLDPMGHQVVIADPARSMAELDAIDREEGEVAWRYQRSRVVLDGLPLDTESYDFGTVIPADPIMNLLRSGEVVGLDPRQMLADAFGTLIREGHGEIDMGGS